MGLQMGRSTKRKMTEKERQVRGKLEETVKDRAGLGGHWGVMACAVRWCKLRFGFCVSLCVCVCVGMEVAGC